MSRFIVFVLLSTIYLFSTAQEFGLKNIKTEDLKHHLSFISSDSLQGRSFTTKVQGLNIAAEYLKYHIEKMGLTGIENDFFQNVPVVSVQPDSENSFLTITENEGREIFSTGTIILLNSSEKIRTVENADFSLAGFGNGQSELQNIEGKIVIIAQGNAESFKNGNNSGWRNNIERNKFNTLSKQNPKAIILVTCPSDKKNSTFNQIKSWYSKPRYTLFNNSEMNDIPIIVAIPEVIDALLGGKGLYEKYLSECADNNQSNLTHFEKYKLNFQVAVKSNQVDAKNVIAVVEGSDPQLKNECVIFMAHYDHLGIDENGEVYNGADDNGSGTVTLLELAEAFMSLEKKPKRSIVFLWVTAEETGMLGSKYYSENPFFPLEKTVVCVNIDMNGRVFEPRDSVWNQSPKRVKDFDGLYTLTNDFWPELKEINNRNCKTLGLIPDYSLPTYFLRSSDHFSFHNKGIPVLNYATGYHADYHKVTDEISRINFDKMKRVADLCFLVGLEIANLDFIEKPEN